MIIYTQLNNEIGLKESKDSNLSSLGISATKLEMRDHNTFPIVMNHSPLGVNHPLMSQ